VAYPPSIAHLKTHGLLGLWVTCANAACQNSTAFTFAALDLDDEVPFPSIARRRQFVCTRCGGWRVNVMPDWRTHNAPGTRR
jgi:hypothetical protein